MQENRNVYTIKMFVCLIQELELLTYRYVGLLYTVQCFELRKTVTQ